MAIDADLNAGPINEEQAKQRRNQVGDEAEYFGSMDGASRYVRGDAIAGLLILFVIGVGVPMHTAHDRASLEDLLDLLSAKNMVLIDTAGMAQRDADEVSLAFAGLHSGAARTTRGAAALHA